MPRIRTIKPEFWSHPVMGRQEDTVKTMAIALLNWADDEGYFYADPSSIRSFARPFDDASTTTLRCLEQLIKIEYLSIRLHETRGYIGKITSFLDHQRIDRAKDSIIKRFYDAAIPTINLRSIDDSSTIDRAGKEGNVKEIETKPSARKTRGVNNSQVAKAAGQTRHSRLQEMIMGWYQEWAGVECPWGGGEGRNLKRMLDSTPNWPDTQFVTCLENLAKSECVPKGERPLAWLEKLPTFLRGPLDRFWKPIGSKANGNGSARQTTAAARTARNLEILVPQGVGHSIPGVHVPDVGAVQSGVDGRGQRADGGISSDEVLERKSPVIDA